jgi:hypothetical protein
MAADASAAMAAAAEMPALGEFQRSSIVHTFTKSTHAVSSEAPEAASPFIPVASTHNREQAASRSPIPPVAHDGEQAERHWASVYQHHTPIRGRVVEIEDSPPASLSSVSSITASTSSLEEHLAQVSHLKNKALRPGNAPGTVAYLDDDDDPMNPEEVDALMSDRVPNSLRWYIVTYGRHPGVYQGWYVTI